MEATTAQRLVRLRLLLHSAQAAAHDETAPGRHAAVVLLDGVCELAMGLAAHEHGVAVPRTLPQLLERLQGALGERWKQEGVQASVELHRARNDVQHYGVLPDGGHIPIWVAEIERFVRSLVAAAFDVELAEVSAASAVDTGEFRERLQVAEEKLTDGEYADSLRASSAAFDAALESFRRQRDRSPFRFSGSTFRQLDEFRVIKGTIESVETFLDVATLAPDPSEWIWLTSALGKLQRTADAPTHEDAQRALAFALAWTLRYEAFAARYASAEVVYRERPRPSLNERYARPQVTDVERGDVVYARDHITFVVRLSEIPPEWDHEVFPALRALQERGDVPPEFSAQPTPDGLSVELPDSFDAERVLALVEMLVAETHRSFETKLDQARKSDEAAAACAESYRAELNEHDPEGRTGEVVAQPARDGGFEVRVAINLPDDLHHGELSAEMLTELREKKSEGSVGLWNGLVTLSPADVPASELLPLLDQAIAVVSQRKTEREAKGEQQARRHESLLRDVRAGLARKAETETTTPAAATTD